MLIDMYLISYVCAKCAYARMCVLDFDSAMETDFHVTFTLGLSALLSVCIYFIY